MIEKVKKHIRELSGKKKNEFGMNAYTHHFISVVRYSKILAKKRNANSEIVEIAAWLHDVGSVLGDYENHHISGAEYAEKFLRKNKYPEEKIQKVKHVIIAHRGSKNIKRESVEAECVSDADAMSHFDNIPSLFYLAFHIRKLDVDSAKEFLKKKLEKSWNKLTKEAKELIKEKHDAVMLLLD